MLIIIVVIVIVVVVVVVLVLVLVLVFIKIIPRLCQNNGEICFLIILYVSNVTLQDIIIQNASRSMVTNPMMPKHIDP